MVGVASTKISPWLSPILHNLWVKCGLTKHKETIKAESVL